MDSAVQQTSVKPPIKSILFVCLSNICRSVALEAVLRHFAKKRGLESSLHIDSCGLGWWHLGEGPDKRMKEVLQSQGIEIEHEAREIQDEDFQNFDYIVAATREILKNLQTLAKKEEHKKKLYLASDFSKTFRGEDMPDPYYGTKGEFEKILEMSEEISLGILQKIAPHQ